MDGTTQKAIETLEQGMAELLKQVQDLTAWKDQHEQQPFAIPLDDVSKANIGSPIFVGPGSIALTESYSVSGGAVTAPRHYRKTVILKIGGVDETIPCL